MLNATPSEIPLQVRYPLIKKAMYGNTPLNSSTAYENTPKARIGFFNDAFLNVWGDMGTYSVNNELENPMGTEDYIYLANETKYTPMTGETNGVNAPRTDGDNAILEMDSTNWATLNRDYYTQNFTNWINNEYYDGIVSNLGYRFVLQSSIFTFDNNQIEISLNLQNKGFARLFKARNASLIIINSSNNSSYSYLLNSDPRTWENDVTISQLIDLSSISAGTYQCYLYIPDSEEELALRPEYSIRLSNMDTWNAENGYNNLNQQIILQSSSIEEFIPKRTKLYQNYPNPFNPIATINFDLAKESNVNILIYNVKGEMVKKLVNNEIKLAGRYTVEFNGSNLPSGIYYYELKAGEYLKRFKAVLVK